jgi:hypothetical protein
MKRSIRLDEKLLKRAEQTGGTAKRSIASQVEYWAEIGESALKVQQASPEQLSELGNFNAGFMSNIKKNVDSGKFRKTMLETGYAFEKSKMGAGFVDKVFQDETRVTGQVTNGVFVELKSKSKVR